MFLRNTEEEARVGVFPTGLFSQRLTKCYGSVLRECYSEAA